MPPSSVAPYLTDIIEAIDHVREKAGTTSLDDFKQDWEQQWIVQRGIEIISEASRRLPDALKARYPDIPWPKIAAVGNVLRHEYRQISPPLLWEIVQDHLAPLGARSVVDFTPFIERGELFAALQEPDYFTREMSIMRGGIGLTWPNEVDFSADGLRHDAFPAEQLGEYDEPTGATAGTPRQPVAPR